MSSKKIIVGCALLVSAVCGYAQNKLQESSFGNYSQKSEMSVSYITPVRVVWTSDKTGVNVKSAENLLKEFNGQVSTSSKSFCTLSTVGSGTAAVLLDFGKEYQGGIQIAGAIRASNAPVRVRVRLGESVSEAMSAYGEDSTATNDHAMRDFVVTVPWLGTVDFGESGFRFVRIDLLDQNVELPIIAVRASFKYRDIPYLGSFRCDNQRLNQIWQTGAYTVHLNMQNYLWDGIKRDRLVWLGDLHPEVMCVNAVFGQNDVVNKSLDFARDETPLPGWMNGMCSYSLWWIIIHRDLYMYQGNTEYLKQQHAYLKDLVAQVIANTDGRSENLSGGVRFLDWPTSENPKVIHAGLQALTLISLEAAAQMALWLDDAKLALSCHSAIDRLRKYTPSHQDNKQAASLLSLAGLLNEKTSQKVLTKGGADGFSTFYGYYMLESLSKSGNYADAMQIISDYWGGMLDLGATTFWEDLTYSDLKRAVRIDELVPAGAYDIHADGGAYCYKGLRHSFCHGWAAGPTPWLSKYVLGIYPVEPGFKKVKIVPNLGNLSWAEGTMPTPYGVITVRHEKQSDNSIKTTIDTPEQIQIVK